MDALQLAAGSASAHSAQPVATWPLLTKVWCWCRLRLPQNFHCRQDMHNYAAADFGVIGFSRTAIGHPPDTQSLHLMRCRGRVGFRCIGVQAFADRLFLQLLDCGVLVLHANPQSAAFGCESLVGVIHMTPTSNQPHRDIFSYCSLVSLLLH